MAVQGDSGRRRGARGGASAARAADGPDTRPAGPSSITHLPDVPAGGDGLTPRQRLVLETIRDAVERRGYPPSTCVIRRSIAPPRASRIGPSSKRWISSAMKPSITRRLATLSSRPRGRR